MYLQRIQKVIRHLMVFLTLSSQKRYVFSLIANKRNIRYGIETITCNMSTTFNYSATKSIFPPFLLINSTGECLRNLPLMTNPCCLPTEFGFAS